MPFTIYRSPTRKGSISWDFSMPLQSQLVNAYGTDFLLCTRTPPAK